jgi:predicted CoA-binding protein
MVLKKDIDDFINASPIALTGVSRDPKKFSVRVMTELVGKGRTVVPVNPHAETIQGVTCFRRLGDINGPVPAVWICTPKAQTRQVLAEAAEKGAGLVWIQQGAETPEALAFAREKGIRLVHHECIMMFLEPVGALHRVHRFFKGLFRKLG